MVPVLHVKFMWLWCWFCYRAYMASPVAHDLHTRFGRLQMWLIGYAGAYAYSSELDFHLCRFFYGSDEAFNAAWDRHLTQHPSAHRGVVG